MPIALHAHELTYNPKSITSHLLTKGEVAYLKSQPFLGLGHSPCRFSERTQIRTYRKNWLSSKIETQAAYRRKEKQKEKKKSINKMSANMNIDKFTQKETQQLTCLVSGGGMHKRAFFALSRLCYSPKTASAVRTSLNIAIHMTFGIVPIPNQLQAYQ